MHEVCQILCCTGLRITWCVYMREGLPLAHWSQSLQTRARRYRQGHRNHLKHYNELIYCLWNAPHNVYLLHRIIIIMWIMWIESQDYMEKQSTRVPCTARGSTRPENWWGCAAGRWKLDPKRSRVKWNWGPKRSNFVSLVRIDCFCIPKDRFGCWWMRKSTPKRLCSCRHLSRRPKFSDWVSFIFSRVGKWNYNKSNIEAVCKISRNHGWHFGWSGQCWVIHQRYELILIYCIIDIWISGCFSFVDYTLLHWKLILNKIKASWKTLISFGDKKSWLPNGPPRWISRSCGRFMGRLGRPVILHTVEGICWPFLDRVSREHSENSSFLFSAMPNLLIKCFLKKRDSHAGG